jgi:hypothetical protein
MSALNLAALLLALAGIAHSYLGERYILIRLLRRADLPKLSGGTQFTARILRLAWHATSIACGDSRPCWRYLREVSRRVEVFAG